MAELSVDKLTDLIQKVCDLRDCVSNVEAGNMTFAGDKIAASADQMNTAKTKANNGFAEIEADIAALTAFEME